MEVKINTPAHPNSVEMICKRISQTPCLDDATNKSIKILSELPIHNGSIRELTNHLQAVLPQLKNSNDELYCELSSLCYFAQVPGGQFRLAKNQQHRELRAQQLAMVGHVEFLEILQKIAQQPCEQKPIFTIKHIWTPGDDPSENWLVTFLYDLAAHLRFAGVRVIIHRATHQEAFSKLAQKFKQYNLREVFGKDVEFSAKCSIGKGYIPMLAELLESCCGKSEPLEQLMRLSVAEISNKTSQYHSDSCKMSALVEPRVYAIGVSKSSVAYTHLLVKHSGNLETPLVEFAPDSQAHVGETNVHVLY